MNKLAAADLASWPTDHHDDGLATLLQTEAILPAQWDTFAVDERTAPERRLLLAILEDALITMLQHSTRRHDPASRRVVIETEKWMASDRRNTAFDFAGLCDVLGLDPDYVRGLVRRVPHRLTKPQRRRSHAGHGHHKVGTASRRLRR